VKRGLVGGEVGRGSFVRGSPRDLLDFGKLRPLQRNAISLEDNVPPILPDLDNEMLKKALNALRLRHGLARQLNLDWHHNAERQANIGQSWFDLAGINSVVEEIHVCTSVQAAMCAAITAFVGPGEAILAPTLSHPGIVSLCQRLNRQLIPVDMDDEGLVPQALERAIRQTRGRMLYIQPTMQSPTTATLSPARRKQIGRIAQRHDVLVLEDDSDVFLLESPPQSILASAPDHVIFLGDTSRAFGLGARLCFAHCPVRLQRAFSLALSATMWMAVPLLGEIIGYWMRTNDGRSIITRRRQELRLRNTTAKRALRGLPIRQHEHSHHLWISTRSNAASDRLVSNCLQRGVLINSSEWFEVAGTNTHGLRLCLGAALSIDELRSAMRVVAKVLRTDRDYRDLPNRS
jgi:DNA-binding transcriptional MocR family regulator